MRLVIRASKDQPWASTAWRAQKQWALSLAVFAGVRTPRRPRLRSELAFGASPVIILTMKSAALTLFSWLCVFAQTNPVYVQFTPNAVKGALYRPDSGPALHVAMDMNRDRMSGPTFQTEEGGQ